VGRLILRYRGSGPAPPDDVATIAAVPGTTVVDRASPRLLLVDGPLAELEALVAGMADWVAARERDVPLEDPRPRPRRRRAR